MRRMSNKLSHHRGSFQSEKVRDFVRLSWISSDPIRVEALLAMADCHIWGTSADFCSDG